MSKQRDLRASWQGVGGSFRDIYEGWSGSITQSGIPKIKAFSGFHNEMFSVSTRLMKVSDDKGVSPMTCICFGITSVLWFFHKTK